MQEKSEKYKDSLFMHARIPKEEGEQSIGLVKGRVNTPGFG